MLPTRDFRSKDTCRLKVKGWKKVIQANGNKKIVGVAILSSDQINFKAKTNIKDQGYYIMIKDQSNMIYYLQVFPT